MERTGTYKRTVMILAAWALFGGRASGDVYIAELLADNENGIRDEDGDRRDWIELYNDSDTAVALDGWWLTDKVGNKTQWRMPAVSIPAQGRLLVWASSKNRADPLQPLHTSFSLSKSGEYLGLYRPDPGTGLPLLVDDYAPGFPALPPDVSYGRTSGAVALNRISAGETGRYRVLTAVQGNTFYWGTDYAAGHLGHGQPGGWNVSAAFDDASWTLAATGIGYDTTGAMSVWVGATPSGNCQSVLRNVNTSLCFRRTFLMPEPSRVIALTLRMKYEDGFVAFFNGTEVARANCTNAMAYNTKANAALSEAIVNSWTEYAISTNLLVAGENLLAIQGVNVTLSSSDFLLLPELATTELMDCSDPLYFSVATPGEANGVGSSGPLLFGATPEDPAVPRPLGHAGSPPLTVTVRVLPTRNPLYSVHVYHRTLWDAESAALALRDDGVAPDAVAGDGFFSASLPTGDVASGQMFRWRFEARDTAGGVTKLPAYLDPLDSPQYFGTVALDTSTGTSQLPVLEWFVQGAPVNGPTAAAFRGACYYLSNFYDNVGHEIHGQSTTAFTKKSYDFDFTGEDRFLWDVTQRRVKDVNLLSNYADKTKTRNTFSHWVGMTNGTPYHFALPIRVHLNGVFHGVMDLVEDGDERMLARNGLDPEGALYKIYNLDIVPEVEKKTRKEEDDSDLRALTNGLAVAKAITSRQTYAYDNIDIAATVNYLTTRFLNSDVDHGRKNYYLYRDTNRTREWQPIIWDVDLSQGHVWNTRENYFDDDLITSILFTAGRENAVYNVVYNSPEMKQMFVRRMRTLMDTRLQAPGTVNGLFETRMREIVATIDPDPANPSPWTDGDLDAARWGIDTRFIQNRPREEVERVVANYFAPRRAFLFRTGAGRPTYGGDPAAAIPDAPQVNVPGMVVIDALDFLPAGGSQAEEYVILRNTTAQAVDLSGWSLEGGVRHTFKGGTVIPPGAGTAAAYYVGLLHVVKDAAAFRARAVGPTGGQRRFVQGNYEGQLSARGGTVTLRDDAGQVIATHTYSGAPTAAQQRLRVTELQYHPADPMPAEATALIGVTADDFEYVELINLGTLPLDLTGAWFSEGIVFTFPATSVGAYQRIVVAKNPVAFAVRYPAVSAPVLGPYSGFLDNAGERLELKDACGETVFDFTYKDAWYPHTDGTGRSLVVRDPVAPQDGVLGEALSWGICYNPLGTPGASDATIAQAYYGWDNVHFTSAQRDDPLVGGPYADPDGDGRVNWAEYALGADPWRPDERPVGFSLLTYARRRYASVIFDRAAYALDVRYTLLATGDLQWELFSPVGSALYLTIPLGNGRETVTLRETTTATAPHRFLKLRVDFTP